MNLDRASSPFLTPGEVAAIFRVDARTVARWADSGLLTSIRTPGGQRRYPRTEIIRLASENGDAPENPYASTFRAAPTPP
ncbi:BldC family transcriptional regulator [Oerskovia rustica]|uniref:BldC family transcriptional regulator n=1 Tax=Oerskovia rustica TaxID=2762237 RepID=A0ABR8RNS1_9CELL|nr:BldC family transcriptional regulator [Oerskovia rustica]MBD7949379.1 BldC family transcriptional regulator [Oerskovia rustica]